MEAIDAIKKIKSANSWQDLFPKKSDYKKEFKTYTLLIHPDRCKLDGAEEAFQKLNNYKDFVEGSFSFKDDAGTVTYSDFSITIEGDEALLKKSLENFEKLTSLKDEASKHFRKYLPAIGKIENEKLIFSNDMKIVSLNELEMPLDHARWVLSRLLEFSAWLAEIGYVHAGINPSSIFVMPENHGIICTSFYHLTKINTPLKTVSSKHASWYPAYIFDKSSGQKPLAKSSIDIELSKRTMIYLLGDKSGNGIMLKKKHEIELINFLTSLKNDSYDAMSEYKALIHKIYGKPTWKEYVI